MATQLLQLNLNMSLSGQSVMNVFYYEMDNAENATDETFIDIGLQFDTNVINQMAAIMSADVGITDLVMKTLLDGVVGAPRKEFTYDPINNSGTQAGEYLPPHDAYGYKLTNNTPAVRQGGKRIPGVLEGAVVDGRYDTGGTLYPDILLMETLLSTALTAQATLPDETNLIPVVVKRIPYLPPDPTPVLPGTDGAAYRLPEDDTEYLGAPVDDAVLVPYITTQNSRKFEA